MICCQIISLSTTYVAISLGLDYGARVISTSVVQSSKIKMVLIQRLNRTFYDECRRSGFTFVVNGIVLGNDLLVDRIHL